MADPIGAAREQWDRASVAWGKWAEVFAQRNDGEQYLQLAEIRPGQRVLEVGAGTGDQTLLLARAVAPQGRVVATDLSEPMLAIARSRVEAAGLDNVEYRAGHAGALGLEEGSFDAAVAGFLLMLVPDPQEVAAAVCRLLAPGGRFVASVWGAPPSAPMLSMPMMVALREVGGPPPDPSGPGLFALAEPARLEEILVAAGFADVTVAPFTLNFGFESAAQYVAFMREVAPPISQLIADRAPEKAETVWEQVEAQAAAQASEDGRVVFTNEALFAVGRRP